MKVLAIDTATEACSAALYIDGQIDSIFEVCPQQHSQKILTIIQTLLERNNIKLDELDGIALGAGPGSFTGVRIAASTAQGLSLGADLPVVQVSTLAAMAQQNFEENGVELTLSLIDARMNEVYKGYYQVNSGQVVELQGEESVLPPQDVAETVGQLRHVNFAGTGYAAYQDTLGLAKLSDTLAPSVQYPDARYMFPLALESLKNGEVLHARDIEPTYLRDKVTWKKLPGRE